MASASPMLCSVCQGQGFPYADWHGQWFEPLQMPTGFYFIVSWMEILPPGRGMKLDYCVRNEKNPVMHLLSRVIRLSRSAGASGFFKRQSQNLRWTISYFPRNSGGKGSKQLWTTSWTLEILYKGENCSSDMSKPSIVAFGYLTPVSRAHELYHRGYWQEDRQDYVSYAVPVPTSAIRRFSWFVDILGLIK